MQKLFTKSLSRSLDPKGRLMLPPEYREALCAGAADGEQGTFWLTSFYGRLVAYLPADWEAVTKQLSRIRFPSPKLSHFKAKVMGLAQDLRGHLRDGDAGAGAGPGPAGQGTHSAVSDA